MAEKVAPVWRCVRTFTLSSTSRFLIARVMAPLGSMLAIVGLRRRPALAALTVAGVGAATGIALRNTSSPIRARKEAAQLSDEENANALDLDFRNPRWAIARRGQAVQTPAFDESECVDGSLELLAGLEGRAGLSHAVPLSASVDVWVAPFAAYHVHELGPIVQELRSRDVDAVFVFAGEPSDTVRSLLRHYAETYHVVDFATAPRPAAILTMNDWGVAEPLVARSRAEGIKLITKVEGAQDFFNDDAPMRQLPYSRSDLVLVQGPYDVANAPTDDLAVVGSVRLEQIWRLLQQSKIEEVAQPPLLNLNFSYGVLGVWSRPWYELAARGFSRANTEFRTSLHPAQELPSYVTDRSRWPLALDIETSSHLVSRRSAAIFDALMIGRPVIYFNPHRERSWRRVEWSDAVPEIRTPKRLASALSTLDSSDLAQQAARRQFLLDTFVSVEFASSAAERAALSVIDQLGSTR